jgi:hypothetical protein
VQIVCSPVRLRILTISGPVRHGTHKRSPPSSCRRTAYRLNRCKHSGAIYPHLDILSAPECP